MTSFALSPITSGYNLSLINNNFIAIQDKFNNNTVWTSSGNNTFSQDIDLNNYNLLNSKSIHASYLYLNGSLIAPSSLVISNGVLKTELADTGPGQGAELVGYDSGGGYSNVQEAIGNGLGKTYADFSSFDSDINTFSAGYVSTIPSINARYKYVSSSEDFTTSGGNKVKVIAAENGLVANAFGNPLTEVSLAKSISRLDSSISGTLGGAPKLLTAFGYAVCASGVSQTVPDFDNTQMDFRAMTLNAKQDGVLFAFNPSINWASIATKRDVTILGGSYQNTASTRTASVAFQLYGMEKFSISDAFFKGFNKAIEIQGKDTYTIRDCFFNGNTYDIYCPSGLVQSNGDVLLSLLVDGCSINPPSSSAGPVYIDDRIIGFWFTHSNINGAAPPQAQIYHANNTSLTPILPSRSLNVIESHFEQIGQYGAIHFDGKTGGIKNVSICRNTFQQTYLNAERMIYILNAQGIRIDGNIFESQNGTVYGIMLDANCTDVTIGLDNEWIGTYNTKIYLNGCPRSEVTIGSGYTYYNPEVLTGFNANTFSTGYGVLPVSTLWSNYSSLWLYPKGYIVRIVASDSGSSTGTAKAAVWAGGTTAGGGSPSVGIEVDISGLGNGVQASVEGFVASNDIGNLIYEFTSSGTNTLTVSIAIVGVVQ